MTTSRVLGLCVGSMLLGVMLGYHPQSQQTARLRSELKQARAWLTEEMRLSEARAEEIQHSSARCARANFELKETEAALMNAEMRIRATDATLGKVTTDWKSERQRRRYLETQIAATYREFPLAEQMPEPK